MIFDVLRLFQAHFTDVRKKLIANYVWTYLILSGWGCTMHHCSALYIFLSGFNKIFNSIMQFCDVRCSLVGNPLLIEFPLKHKLALLRRKLTIRVIILEWSKSIIAHVCMTKNKTLNLYCALDLLQLHICWKCMAWTKYFIFVYLL